MEITPKLKDAYIQRMNPELKAKFLALSEDKQAKIIKVLDKFHEIIEEQTFQLLLGIIKIQSQEK